MNEIDEIIYLEDLEKLLNNIILCINQDPFAISNLLAKLSDKTLTAIQKVPYTQLKRYIDGVKIIEEDLGESIKLSEKLFSDPKKKNENAMRIFKEITSTDIQRKIDYMIDTTRAMLIGLIDVEMMFRIFKAIVESMPEDLEYLTRIVEKEGSFKGNMNVLALVRTGLMISAGIDSNADIEEQEYHITKLGYYVDRFALSFKDDKRLKWYKNNEIGSIRIFDGYDSVSDKEIKALFDSNIKNIKS